MNTIPNHPINVAYGPLTEMYVGLTKREYFAAMAMKGLLAGAPDDSRSFYAQEAVIMADALIVELNKQP